MKFLRIYNFSRIYTDIKSHYIINFDDLLINCLFSYIHKKSYYVYKDENTTITYSAIRDELILVNTDSTRVYSLSNKNCVYLFNLETNILDLESELKNISISKRFINLFYEAAGINIKM